MSIAPEPADAPADAPGAEPGADPAADLAAVAADPAGLPRLCIVGPTASGKGALAIEVALRLGGEVLSVDSMKVYREMDIATAKPSAAKRRGVRFHLIDLRAPHERMSAAEWVEAALAAEREVRARGRVPIYAGGTALYLKALTEGLFEGPPRDPALRARLAAEAADLGAAALHARLRGLDPAAAARLHPNDLRRVVRALEVHALTGRPISEQQREWARAPRPDRLLCALAWERDALYARIDERVVRMVEQGLVDEVRALRARPEGLSDEAAQALGVKELLAWMAGGEVEPLAAVVARIQQNSRRFAKRQLTFFAHFPDRVLLDPRRGLEALADEVVGRYRARAGGAAGAAAAAGPSSPLG